MTVSSSRPEFCWLSLARVLWKRKRSLLAIWLAASALSGVVVMRMPAVYRSEALVLVEGQRIPEKYVAATVDNDLRARLSTISQQILSYTRLVEVIESFDLYHSEREGLAEEEVVERMRRDIEIELVRGWSERRPGAFRIAYEGSGAAVVAQVANRLANLFIDENLRAREVQAVGTSEFLNQQLDEAQQKLEDLEARLGAYKGRFIGQLPEQEGALLSAASGLRTRLESAAEATHRAEQKKVVLESALDAALLARSGLAGLREASGSGAASLERLGQQAPEPAPAEQQRGRLEAELRALRARYSEQHPDVKKKRAALARLHSLPASPPGARPGPPTASFGAKPAGPAAASAARAKTARPGVGRNPALVEAEQRVASLTSQQALLEEQLVSLAAERQELLGRLAAVQTSVEKLPLREQELASITRDYEISRAYYRSLLDKKLAADLATEMERRQKAERFVMLDVARVPTKPIKPNRPLWSLLGSLTGLLLAAVWAFGREFQKNVVLGDWELPATVAVLGRIPPLEPLGANCSLVGGRGRRLTIGSSLAVSLLVACLAMGIYLGWVGF